MTMPEPSSPEHCLFVGFRTFVGQKQYGTQGKRMPNFEGSGIRSSAHYTIDDMIVHRTEIVELPSLTPADPTSSSCCDRPRER